MAPVVCVGAPFGSLARPQRSGQAPGIGMTDDTDNQSDLNKLATDNLASIIDEYGQANTTVGKLLAQFGHETVTSEAVDDVWEALRDAGLREEPLLTKAGLTAESSLKVRRLETKGEKEERSFITWGFIGAVIFAPVGIFFGIRLLTRERVGPGLAIIFTAVALWGAGTVLVLGQSGSGPAAQNYNAHNPTIQIEVASAIEAKAANGGVTVTNVSCVASSDSQMTCLGHFTSNLGSGQDTYSVTVDTNTGHYIINSPQVSFNSG